MTKKIVHNQESSATIEPIHKDERIKDIVRFIARCAAEADYRTLNVKANAKMDKR